MVRALLVRLTKPLVIGAAIIAALSQIGVDIRVLLAIPAAGALAIGIGLSGPVSSLIAGGILFSRRPFRAGDTRRWRASRGQSSAWGGSVSSSTKKMVHAPSSQIGLS